MWPSVFTLGSFRRLAGLLLFSSGLVEISFSLVGRLSGKTLSGKNPFLSCFSSGKPNVLGKTCPLFGAHRDWSLFLAVSSLPIFGRFLCRKNPYGKKPLSFWEKPFVLYQSSGSFGRFLRLLSMVI